MIRTIARKELLSHLLTFRFLMGFMLCFVLVVVNVRVLVQGYEGRLRSYWTAVKEYRDEIRKIERYSELGQTIRPKAYKKPKLLSVFSEGMEVRLGNSVRLSHGEVPAVAEELGADNPYLAAFQSIDLSRVFQVVLSLLALLFAYDAVSGEKEDGTLRLTLANPVPRYAVLLAKYLSGMLCLLLPLAVGLLAGLLVMGLSGYVAFTSEDWMRTALLVLVSVLYVSAFFTLGLFLSCRTDRTATTLMFCIFLWVFLVPVYPSAAVFAVDQLSPMKSHEPLEEQYNELWRQFNREVEDFLKAQGVKPGRGHIPLQWAMWSQLDCSGRGIRSGSRGRRSGETISVSGIKPGQDKTLAFIGKFCDFKENLRIQYAERCWQVFKDYLQRNPIRQAKLARAVSRISPAAAYYEVLSVLAGTDLGAHERFLKQAREYRQSLIRYLREQQAFSSPQWFTVEQGEADLTGMPHFKERPETVGESLRRAMPDILILLILNVVFFMAAFVSFLRYDVT